MNYFNFVIVSGLNQEKIYQIMDENAFVASHLIKGSLSSPFAPRADAFMIVSNVDGAVLIAEKMRKIYACFVKAGVPEEQLIRSEEILPCNGTGIFLEFRNVNDVEALKNKIEYVQRSLQNVSSCFSCEAMEFEQTKVEATFLMLGAPSEDIQRIESQFPEVSRKIQYLGWITA